MKEKFQLKILPRIGDPDHGGEVSEGTRFHRITKWNHQGFSWEADPKYAVQLAKDMGLDKAKGVETPASRETGKNKRNVDRLLKDKDAKWFGQMAGTALYLS
jgi:hypothetical protein